MLQVSVGEMQQTTQEFETLINSHFETDPPCVADEDVKAKRDELVQVALDVMGSKIVSELRFAVAAVYDSPECAYKENHGAGGQVQWKQLIARVMPALHKLQLSRLNPTLNWQPGLPQPTNPNSVCDLDFVIKLANGKLPSINSPSGFEDFWPDE